MVLNFATVSEWRKGDNPARWTGHLEHKFTVVRKVKPHAAVPYDDMPAVLTALVELRTTSG